MLFYETNAMLVELLAIFRTEINILFVCVQRNKRDLKSSEKNVTDI